MLASIAAIAAFPPVAAHKFLIGKSGVAWLGANFFFVCAALLMMRGEARSSVSSICAAVISALLAGQMYSTGLIAVLAIGGQPVLLPKTRRLGVVLRALGVLQLTVMFVLQQKPGSHSERTFDVLKLGTFGLAFIGAALTPHPHRAMFPGGCDLLAFMVLLMRCLRQDRDRSGGAFWIVISGYALMNAGLASIGRAGMGGDSAAMTSRYASLASLFWIALLGLALAPRGQTPMDSRRVVGPIRRIVLLGCVFALMAVIAAKPRIDAMRQRAQGKRIAAMAIWLGAPDHETIEACVTSAPGQLDAAIPALRAIGHMPFDNAAGCLKSVSTSRSAVLQKCWRILIQSPRLATADTWFADGHSPIRRVHSRWFLPTCLSQKCPVLQLSTVPGWWSAQQ